MSFAVAIHDIEEMEKTKIYRLNKYTTQKRLSIQKEYTTQKRLSIQKEYPVEYAEYEKTKDIQKLTENIDGWVHSASHQLVIPRPIGSPYISVEDATEKGLRYVDTYDDIGKNILIRSIDEFKSKYPQGYALFIRGKHDYKPSKFQEISRLETLRACYEAIFLSLRNTYDTEHPVKEPKAKPVKEPKAKPVKEPKAKPVKEPKKSIPSSVKKLVWNTNLGEELGKAKCYSCKSTDITQTSFHCGHVIAASKGGQSIVSNLKPICQNCNSSMGTTDMNEFMKQFL
jgi:5-methylcytosine-specific restriction endonuclease McrA